MNNEELPDYKQNFLNEMNLLRQQEAEQHERESGLNDSRLNAIPNKSKEQHLPENNIINTSQYSAGLWKQHLNQTHYKKNHNDTHYDLNLLVNPEIAKKQHNIQLTTISEYSNAMHNKTVFVNPKNISC